MSLIRCSRCEGRVVRVYRSAHAPPKKCMIRDTVRRPQAKGNDHRFAADTPRRMNRIRPTTWMIALISDTAKLARARERTRSGAPIDLACDVSTDAQIATGTDKRGPMVRKLKTLSTMIVTALEAIDSYS